jgi:hypothetical protein
VTSAKRENYPLFLARSDSQKINWSNVDEDVN